MIILDASSAVLLLRYQEYRSGRGGCFWTTPGGALEAGEDALAAAKRELREETGLTAPIGRALWCQRFTFELPNGEVEQEEQFFLVRLAEASPAVHNSTSEAILEHRWWTLDDLRATTDAVYPDGLATQMAALVVGAA